ncbi:hypothetical protein NIES4071_103010 (plasmid) [Calothrix sp. NIES-4071]|nr:hypothetical protein NIES4071_103010 [Calothrix sp. NIES-4071]BAZ64682.1 hypothetical protein NIES4105_104150 [Calothrix sp. NIES-4105]
MEKYIFCALFLIASGCSFPQTTTTPTITQEAVTPSSTPTQTEAPAIKVTKSTPKLAPTTEATKLIPTEAPTTEVAIESTPKLAPTAEAVEPNITSTQQATLVSEQSGERINVRDGASVKTYARHYGLSGDKVEVFDQKQDENGATWYRVRFVQSGARGWVHNKFVALESESSAPISEIPATLQTPQIVSYQPIRESISGSCECPYDTDRRGRRCGGRSAYSRPGGSAPACYVGEQ